MTRGRSGRAAARAVVGMGPASVAARESTSTARTARFKYPRTRNMAISPVRKTASSEYPLLRQPGCQVHHLTRGFASPPHGGFSLFGKGAPRRIPFFIFSRLSVLPPIRLIFFYSHSPQNPPCPGASRVLLR